MQGMDRLKAWLRAWLGLDCLATVAHVKALESMGKQRHGEVLEILNRIEKRMIQQHVGAVEQYSEPILDWDTVQAMALHQLEKESQ